MTLDDRKAAILRAVVTQYIETALPVGSNHVAAAPDIDVSSATVRNEMVTLEEEGYLEQPHTSAGRIPTQKGYRYYVDAIERPKGLARREGQQVSDFFAHAHGALERMLDDTSQLLVDLTDHTAVVVGPDHDSATVRSVNIVGLSDHSALVVVVLSDGGVTKYTVDLEIGPDDSRLRTASRVLDEALSGKSLLGVAAATVPPAGDATVDTIVRRVVDRMATESLADAEHVFVGGAARMASAFDAIETVKGVLHVLEQQLVVVSMMRDILNRGRSVAIGEETGITLLANCSLVVAPYEIDGEPAGTIGVLGPTRMDYARALSVVDVVGSRLSHHLSDTR